MFIYVFHILLKAYLPLTLTNKAVIYNKFLILCWTKNFSPKKLLHIQKLLFILYFTIDNSRTGLDTSKNQCSAPAVTALKNYWRYHVYNLFRLKNSPNVFAIIIIIIGCLTGNIIHDQLKLRPYFLPWVSKNRRYVSTIQSLFLIVLT